MKNNLFISFCLTLGIAVVSISCNRTYRPDKVKVVEHFDTNRYLGTWYEIARFDFRFEKDLDNTSAHYSLDADGNIVVLNSGFNVKEKEWKQAVGQAKFRGDNTVGALKVSFFGPFYSGYNIIALDADYQYALIAGKNLDYLWILSRTKDIPEAIKKQYLDLATAVGYDISELLWVIHDREDNPFLNQNTAE